MRRLQLLLSILLLSLSHNMLPAAAQSCASPNWEGKFYNNTDFTGSAAHTACTPVIDFNWGPGAPAGGVNIDNFSARFTSTQSFPTAGTYLFTVEVEDGVRLYVNGVPIINSMNDPDGPRTLTANHTVTTAGSTAFLTLEVANYVGNAQAKLVWSLTGGAAPPSDPNATTQTTTTNQSPDLIVIAPEPAPVSGQPWTVEFFNNMDLTGDPASTTTIDPEGVAVNWGEGSAGEGLNADEWSARWTRTVEFPEGIYTFTLRADDGARVFIDGIQILDQAQYFEGVNLSVDVQIPAGPHVITIEYWELGFFANLFLTWDPPVGTTYLPDGCNSPIAGVGGSAEPCPGLQPAGHHNTDCATTHYATGHGGRWPPTPASRPATDNTELRYIHRGEAYTAIGRSNDNLWLQLQVGDLTGWSMVQFLTVDGDMNTLNITDGTAATTPTQQGVSVVTSSAATTDTTTAPAFVGLQARALGHMRIRSAPNDNASRVGGVAWGEVVNVLGRTSDNKWIQITASGVSGWSAAPWFQFLDGRLENLPITG